MADSSELTPRDVELLQMTHEEYFMGYRHFRMLFRTRTQEERDACALRIGQLSGRGYLEERYSNVQELTFFTLAKRGLDALKRRNRRDHWLPLFVPPDNLNRGLAERLRSVTVRLILWELGLKAWTSERLLREHGNLVYPVPNGTVKVKGRKIAIHVQSALARSPGEYKELFEGYERRGDYDQVWMILSRDVMSWFEDWLDETNENDEYDFPHVWFAVYEDFIQKGYQTLFRKRGKVCEWKDLLY